MSTKLLWDGATEAIQRATLKRLDAHHAKYLGRLLRPKEVSNNLTLPAQVPFAYGLSDDPESRSLKAVEGE